MCIYIYISVALILTCNLSIAHPWMLKSPCQIVPYVLPLSHCSTTVFHFVWKLYVGFLPYTSITFNHTSPYYFHQLGELKGGSCHTHRSCQPLRLPHNMMLSWWVCARVVWCEVWCALFEPRRFNGWEVGGCGCHRTKILTLIGVCMVDTCVRFNHVRPSSIGLAFLLNIFQALWCLCGVAKKQILNFKVFNFDLKT